MSRQSARRAGPAARDDAPGALDVPEGTAPEVAELCLALRREFPRFRLVAKEQSAFMRRLYRLGLMALWNPRFLESYTTTIGYAVYIPAAVRGDARAGVAVLRHERIHLLQFQRHPVWFPLSYLLVLPCLITFRARWELEAYIESMRVELEREGHISDATIEHILRRFTGPDYFFMDVRRGRVRKKLEAARAALVREAGGGTK